MLQPLGGGSVGEELGTHWCCSSLGWALSAPSPLQGSAALLRAVGSGLLPSPSLLMPLAQKVSEVLANPAVPRAAPRPARASLGSAPSAGWELWRQGLQAALI